MLLLGQGTSKFLVGATVGAVGGFAVGAFATTTTARSARQSVLGGLDVSARFLGRTVLQAVGGLGSVLESGYTRVRGRASLGSKLVSTPPTGGRRLSLLSSAEEAA
jgi:hypothetical protein